MLVSVFSFLEQENDWRIIFLWKRWFAVWAKWRRERNDWAAVWLLLYFAPNAEKISQNTFQKKFKNAAGESKCWTIWKMVKSKKKSDFALMRRNGIDRFWKVVKIRCWRRRTGSYWQPRQTRVTKSVQHLTIQNFKPQTGQIFCKLYFFCYSWKCVKSSKKK